MENSFIQTVLSNDSSKITDTPTNETLWCHENSFVKAASIVRSLIFETYFPPQFLNNLSKVYN